MACIPAYAAGAFLEFVAAHAAKGDEDAQRLMARVRRNKPIPKEPPPGPTVEQRRAEHRESTATLRAQVEKRSEGKCEACRGEYGSVWELHHVESGGARRAHQRLGSVLALCMPCHRWAHRGNADTLTLIAQSPVLDAEAQRAAEWRVTKQNEARRVAP